MKIPSTKPAALWLRPLLLLALALHACLTYAETPGNMIGQQSQNEGIHVLPTPGTVTIDGDLDDWDLSGRIWVFADKATRDDYSVKISAMWDQDYLYLAARWADPTPMFSIVDPDFNPENGWKSDSWQMRILTDHKSHYTSWYFTEKQMPLMHITHNKSGYGGDVMRSADGKDLGRGVQMVYRKTSDSSFTQEIRIPWKELYQKQPTIQPGLTFRLGNELLWGDATGGKYAPAHRYADNMQPDVTSREFYWTNDKAWGNATLVAKGNIEKRRYFSEGTQPKGLITVRASIATSASTFTLAINDAKGSRIRNLIGGSDPADFQVAQTPDSRTVEVKWDGLDDEGKLVPPGTYTVVGLTHTGLDAIYEMSYYNPGTPIWKTADGRGGWGSDHADPLRVARAADMMIISYSSAEGGAGLIGLDPDGKKAWSERMGAKFMTADAHYVYGINRNHLNHLLTLSRFKAADGAYAPFVLDGKERPFELELKTVLEHTGKEDIADVATIARHRDHIAISLTDGKLALLNATTAVLQTTCQIPGIVALVSDGNTLFGATESTLFSIDTATGKTTPIPTAGIGRITALTADANGNIIIADMGPDKQLKAFSPAGKLLYTCGTKGGRPIRGTYDPQAMLRVSSIDIDHTGTIWAVENWANPRRISLWSPTTGKLVRDYVGCTGYSARSTYLTEDPDTAYVGPVKMAIDRQTKTYTVTEILRVPDRAKNEAFSLWSGSHWYSCPKFFTAELNNKQTRLIYNNGLYRRHHTIYAYRNNCWQPAATITTVEQLKVEVPNLEQDLANHDNKEGVFWNDLNQDAAVSLDECIFAEKPLTFGSFWGTSPGSDGSLFLSGNKETYRYQPIRYADDGAPLYGPEGMTKLPTKLESDTIPIIADDIVLSMGGHPRNGGWLQAHTLDATTTIWRYPNPYPGVHGSHNAPMPQPGLLVGPLNIIGTATVNDSIGKVLMIRGNLGTDYLLTVKDGLFIGTLFNDLRLPMPILPPNEADLYGKSVAKYTNGGEPFNGWFGNQNDGKIRMLNGMAGQAGMIYEIKGLDSIARLNPTSITLDIAQLAAAEADNQARAARAATPDTYTLTKLNTPPTFDGKSAAWKGIDSLKIVTKGNPSTGVAKLAYTDTHLYATITVRDDTPWINNGKEWDKLFKTGDAVDIQLRTTPSDAKTVIDGDLRILIAPYQGNPIAVLMQPIAKTAPDTLKRAYHSPVTTKVFDRVEQLSGAQLNATVKKNYYTIEIGIPLADIGLKLDPKTALRGDLGFILSDQTGTFNIARIYWANRFTNLVNDLPHESWITPSAWGIVDVK